MAQDARWFSAGMFIVRDPKNGEWMVLGRTSKQSPGFRFPGGCEEPDLNEKTPEETLVREFFGETQRYNPYEYVLVHEEPFPRHSKRWYLINKAAGEVDFDYKAEGMEPDGEYIYIMWLRLRDLMLKMGGSHAKALKSLLIYKARTDGQFAIDNSDILPR